MEFIDVVFGDIFGIGYLLGLGVEFNLGVINLWMLLMMLLSDLYDMVVNMLKLYVISVVYEEGEVKIYVDLELKELFFCFILLCVCSLVLVGL